MKKQIFLLMAGMLLVFFTAGCSVLQEIVPLPGETANPTATTAIVTATPLPTLGELEWLDAAFCLQSEPDAHELEFFVLRFFKSGVVMQVTVKGQDSCKQTWEYINPFLKETATDIYNHGEYEYSQGQIRFALAPPGSDEMSGEVNGRIEDNQLILEQQGTEKIYNLVYGGK
ncbi:MAG: hypothetical protein HN948_06510 [Clostridia bacterium]|jgi:hypothetical protein|nr:hypothetical protein [Clostridia bacterium]MBT7122644.1 hypothetical protein [Clostridia bacterium]